ncbi:MAG: hypothetical protein JXR76_31935 [Deltaproteobacteria bacterium]|nr:hypothetical protein [Deltaproteobacteria bacterium]
MEQKILSPNTDEVSENYSPSTSEECLSDFALPLVTGDARLQALNQEGYIENLSDSFDEILVNNAQYLEYSDLDMTAVSVPISHNGISMSFMAYLDANLNVLKSIVIDSSDLQMNSENDEIPQLNGTLRLYSEFGEIIKTIHYANNEVDEVEDGIVLQKDDIYRRCSVGCAWNCISDTVPWYYIAACGAACVTNVFICSACIGFAGAFCLDKCGC